MVPIIRHKNRRIYADLAPLIEAGIEQSYITVDVAAAASALTVKDIDGFAVNQILLIGELGSEGAEIIKTHASTAPTGSTVTLASALEFAHGAGTKIYVIEFDQIEFSHADTLTGSKSVLATESIQADQTIQDYLDTTETTGYYFARFKESIGSTFGAYTDGIPYGGYANTTVGYAIDWAMRRNKCEFDSEITRQFCIEELNDFLNEWQGSQKRWPQHQSLDTVISEITAGVGQYSLPSDIYDDDSNKSILNIRVGDGTELTYKDPLEWESYKKGENRTQVATQAVATDTTLELDDTSDFDDSGTVEFFVSGTKYTATYTSNNRSTNILSGIPASGTGAITVTVAVDTDIYQGADFGEPQYFTIRGGNVHLEPIPGATQNNRNLWGDYWTVATQVDSEGDDLDVTRFDAAKYYLAWKIKMHKKNNGELDEKDGYFITYRRRLTQAVRNKPNHIKYKNYPKVFRRVTD